jgi:hypothetical protein
LSLKSFSAELVKVSTSDLGQKDIVDRNTHLPILEDLGPQDIFDIFIIDGAFCDDRGTFPTKLESGRHKGFGGLTHHNLSHCGVAGVENMVEL